MITFQAYYDSNVLSTIIQTKDFYILILLAI